MYESQQLVSKQQATIEEYESELKKINEERQELEKDMSEIKQKHEEKKKELSQINHKGKELNFLIGCIGIYFYFYLQT